MEVAVDELEHLLLVAIDVGTQGAVAIGAEALDDTVNHSGAKHIVLLEHCTLTFQAIGRSLATIGKASQ